MENVFFEIHLPKAKPITVGIVYRPLNQTDFIKTFNENFAKLDAANQEITFLRNLMQLIKKLTFLEIST